eukprot:TRINITY_DN8694_c0_g1_i1.p1 TRINITY_DN8694_c0_g1~~TRINITY_DN8694_c0_g1_i1.p1  ORF type:complete len:491 (+),score=155.10 TRINITY_DN8694_c0_g1_i1:101-1573(+)
MASPQRQPVHNGAYTDCDAESRMRQRQRQVEIGKATEGYHNYVQRVPPAQRVEGQHLDTPPVSPSSNRDISKRDFEGKLRVWRKFLHRWDTHPVPPPPRQHPHPRTPRRRARGVGGRKGGAKAQVAAAEMEDEAAAATHYCCGPPTAPRPLSTLAGPFGGPPPPPPPPGLPLPPPDGLPPPPEQQGPLRQHLFKCCSRAFKHNVRLFPSLGAPVTSSVLAGAMLVLTSVSHFDGKVWGRIAGPELSWVLIMDEYGVRYMEFLYELDPLDQGEAMGFPDYGPQGPTIQPVHSAPQHGPPGGYYAEQPQYPDYSQYPPHPDYAEHPPHPDYSEHLQHSDYSDQSEGCDGHEAAVGTAPDPAHQGSYWGYECYEGSPPAMWESAPGSQSSDEGTDGAHPHEALSEPEAVQGREEAGSEQGGAKGRDEVHTAPTLPNLKAAAQQLFPSTPVVATSEDFWEAGAEAAPWELRAASAPPGHSRDVAMPFPSSPTLP